LKLENIKELAFYAGWEVTWWMLA